MISNDYQIGGSHYCTLDIQPWDAMQVWLTPAEFRGFLIGGAIKYLARAGKKVKGNKKKKQQKKRARLEDLKKAQHYLSKLIEIEAGDLHPPELGAGGRHPLPDPAAIQKLMDDSRTCRAL